MFKAEMDTMQYQPRTSWVKPKAASAGLVPIKEVGIPDVGMRRKGHTKYDDIFLKMLDFKNGIETTMEGGEVIRRSLQRFIIFRKLSDTVRMRRQMDKKTRMVTVWLEKKEQK
jgi:hypothetical protein